MTLTLTGGARTRDDPRKLNLREHLTAALERWPLELRKLGVFGQWRRWQQDTPQGKDTVGYFHVCLPR